MSKQFKLAAKVRDTKPQASRQQGSIPAVLYGHGVANQSLEVDARAFRKVIKDAGYTSLINLAIEGDAATGDDATHTVLVREVQTNPVRGNMLHIDFYQVRLDEAIRAHVPLSFTGEAPAVKNLGGVLVRSLDEVEVEALPTDLPHDIQVDITLLKDFDTVIHISDLNIPDSVKLFHEPEDVVALVQPPRTEEELAALDEEVSGDVDSVEGVEDKEAAEGEEGTEESSDDTPEAEDKASE